MNRRLRIFTSGALLLVAAVLMTACGGSSPASTTATMATTETAPTTEADTATAEMTTVATTAAAGGTIYTEDTTTIDVTAGDSVTIQLPIDPSTGYTWVPYFPLEYMQLSDEILETESDGAVGVGTHEQFVIAINTAGPAEIVFDYFPPGNGVKSERSVTFTVNAS